MNIIIVVNIFVCISTYATRSRMQIFLFYLSEVDVRDQRAKANLCALAGQKFIIVLNTRSAHT